MKFNLFITNNYITVKKLSSLQRL